MSKSITTLVADIYSLFESPPNISKEQADRFGENLAKIIALRLGREDKVPALRMSMLGTLCLRKLWYQINSPELGESLDGQTRLKFLYGDILECLLLFLAELAGHEVTGQQDELDILGVKGHRDAIIDGVLVDVKSASPFGFKKFEFHSMASDDPFGYLDQIFSYLFASRDDDLLVEKKKAAFLAVEKSLGKLALDVYPAPDTDYAQKVADIKVVLAQPEPPARFYSDDDEVKWVTRKGVRVPSPTGNKVLGVECSYCSFKSTCWPGLEVRASAGRAPKFYTKLVNDPKKTVKVEAADFNDPVSEQAAE